MKAIITVLLSCFLLTNFGQETLLLGEQRVEEVYFQSRTDNAIKISFYGFKYKKKSNYKDSILIGFETYNQSGYLESKISFSGKNKSTSNQFSYAFIDNLMTSYSFLHVGDNSNYGRSGRFKYNSQQQLIYQEHSLANIKYEYYTDGRMKTKSYHYNNKGVEDSEPWTHYYFYDDSLNLIHVDTDINSTGQTSFYNDNNELIKNDYYPGVAYSTYEYDENGNCTKQTDFEMEKRGWSSKSFYFVYTTNNQLASSSSTTKRGKIELNEEHFYLKNGELDYIIYLQKNKRKQIKRVNYIYPKK